MFVTKTDSPEETIALAERLTRYVQPGTVIAISGDLGAGKTLFAKGIAQGLGIGDHIASPTFSLINEYPGRIPFYHMDVYRLEDENEVWELGIEEYFKSPGICLVEWPERIQAILPKTYLKIEIEKIWDEDGEESRKIKFIPIGTEFEEMIGEFMKNESSRS